jgi:lipid-A-disaccharide synthase
MRGTTRPNSRSSAWPKSIAHLPRLLRVRRALRERMLAWKPDVFVGIDAPDFNLGVEKWLKQRGIRTVHDVSPSLWAWRQSRAAKIGQSADRVLCLFPMEPPIYAQHGVDARYIGHPLADALPLEPDRNAAREALRIAQDARVLAVLPGSRLGRNPSPRRDLLRGRGAIVRRTPRFADRGPRGQRRVPARDRSRAARRSAARDRARRPGAARDDRRRRRPARLRHRRARSDALQAADGRRLPPRAADARHRAHLRPAEGAVRVAAERAGGRSARPELLQDDCTPDKLADALRPLLSTPEPGLVLQARFRDLHLALRRDASARAADAIAELLDAPAPLA